MAVININRNQFEEMVHSGKTVLVEFSAPWCVYCRRLAPALESVAEEYKDSPMFSDSNYLLLDALLKKYDYGIKPSDSALKGKIKLK